MQRKITYILFCFIISTTFINSQVTQEWVSRFNSGSNAMDYSEYITLDNSGNVYVAGRVTLSATNTDIAIIKYNSSGVQQWVQYYGGSGLDEVASLKTDLYGNVFVTGSIYSGVTTHIDYITVKYNTLGVQQWANTYTGNGPYTDKAHDMEIDASGNVYVTGESHQYNTSYDFLTIKYDNNGNLIWTNRFGSDVEGAAVLSIDSQGDIIVSGFLIKYGNRDILTAKLDADGNLKWSVMYINSSGNDIISSMTTDNSDNIIITGKKTTSGNADYLTLKYNSSGNLVWEKTYGGTSGGADFAYDVDTDINGNIFVTGESENTGTGADYCTIKYLPDGTLKWVKSYHGSIGNDYARNLKVDNYGNVYVTGFSNGYQMHNDYLTLKYSNDGVLLWNMRYEGPFANTDKSNMLSLDYSGGVYVTGWSYGIGTGLDFATIKYSSEHKILINHKGNEICVAESAVMAHLAHGDFVVGTCSPGNSQPLVSNPAEVKLYDNYPNPFNPVTFIKFYIPEMSYVSIKIYNTAGMEVFNALNENIDAGEYEFQWNASANPSGVYFCKIMTVANGQAVNKIIKMILMK